MALLLPFLLDDPIWTFSVGPATISNQQFGICLEPEDVIQPLHLNNREVTRTPAGYLRRWHSRESARDTGSTVSHNKDKFEASLDCQQFKPEEIIVKVTGENMLTIEGKLDEKEDEHGFISREFVRKYVVPKNYDIAKIESKLSADGLLTITAPAIEEKSIEHKSIPITQTGEPARQQKKQENEAKWLKNILVTYLFNLI